MADKTYVTVNCETKELFDSGLKSGLVKAMTKDITEAINTQSSGKLTTKTKCDDEIILTATLVSLTADDKDKPTKLEAAISFSGMKPKPSVKTFKSSKPATAASEGVGPDVQAAANQLVGDILETAMKTVIKSLVSL